MTPRRASDWVAIILAAGLSLAVSALVIGVSVAAIEHGNSAATLSENESQVLTAAFGGMIGVLGAWVGYRARDRQSEADPEAAVEEQQPTVPQWPRGPDHDR